MTRALEYIAPAASSESLVASNVVLAVIESLSAARIQVRCDGRLIDIVGVMTLSLGLSPELRVGDKVLVAETSQGAVIQGLVQPLSETAGVHFRIEDGKLVLEAAHAVTLKCGAATVELTGAGTVRLNGKYIAAVSEGPHQIKGSIIELN